MNRQRLLKYASASPLFKKLAFFGAATGALGTAMRIGGAAAFAAPILRDQPNSIVPDLVWWTPSAAGREVASVLRPHGKISEEAGRTAYQGEVAQRLSRQPVLAQPDGAPTIMSAARSGSRATGIVPPPQPPQQVA